jgi:hypothetical protein
MQDPVDALVLDLIEWVGREGRSYREAMEVWRTSCPRLPVWEETHARGFLGRNPTEPTQVVVTSAGWAYLERRRSRTPA